MRPLCGLLGISLEEGRFDDQRIGILSERHQLFGIGSIPDHDQPAARLRRSQNVIGRNVAPVRQHDLFALEQPAALWPRGNLQRGQPVRQHPRARLLLEHEAEAVITAVRHRKGPHAQMVILDDGARLDGGVCDLEFGTCVRPDHLGEQTSHHPERCGAAVHRELAAGFEKRQGGHQSTEAEQVVEMSMGEQDAVQPTKSEPAPQQLALRALTAVHEKPAVPVQNDQRRQPPLDGGHTCGGAKENHLEQISLTPGAAVRACTMTSRLPIPKPGDSSAWQAPERSWRPQAQRCDPPAVRLSGRKAATLVEALRGLGGGSAGTDDGVYKAVLAPDVEQGSNTNMVVRRDPATGDRSAFSRPADIPDGAGVRPRARGGDCSRVGAAELACTKRP